MRYILLFFLLMTFAWGVQVPANERWVPVQNVSEGDYTFNATGRVRIAGYGSKVNYPQGINITSPSAVCPRAPLYSLVGRVGENCFYIGDYSTVRMNDSGTLYLSVNDNFFEDNFGAYEVNIESSRVMSFFRWLFSWLPWL